MRRRSRKFSLGDVAAKAGVRLTAGQKRYADMLQQAVSFAITVTSGNRTPEEQASAMMNKWKAKGAQELYKVYRSNRAIIDELLKAPKTVSAWAAIIRDQGMKLSRHLWSGAVDLRTRDLTPDQVEQIKRAVTQTGGRAYVEYDHLHVDLPAKYASMAAGEEIAKSAARSATRGYGMVLGLGVAGALIYGFWKWKKRRDMRVLVVGP